MMTIRGDVLGPCWFCGTEYGNLHDSDCPEGCTCGSGFVAVWYKDARGIELFKGCHTCSPAKLKRYRPEVLTDPNYYADEPIEEDE